MIAPAVRPQAWLDGCARAHRRLDALAERVTDDIARRASLLPGWTVGHVLTHLARNADSHRRAVEAAWRGEIVARYAGGQAERAAGIEAGYGRPAAELIADVKESNRRLEEAWATTNEGTWETGLSRGGAGTLTLADGVLHRWREVEVHLADLGLTDLGGPAWDDLSPAYVNLELQDGLGETAARLPQRLPPGVTVILIAGDRPPRAYGNGAQRIVVRGTAHQVLRWLFGRGGDPAWPTLSPWT